MSPEWLKEYLVKEYFDGLNDKIDASKHEVLSALKAHEKYELSHLKRIEKRQAELEAWKGRATLALAAMLVVVAASSPIAGAVFTAII